MKEQTGNLLALLAWASFLNLLLFIPYYLWHLDEGGLWLFAITNQEQTTFYDYLFISDNHNPFRLCGEFIVASAIFWWGRKNAKQLQWLFIPFYLFLFTYQVYFGFYQKIYGTLPSFLDDWLFVKDVLPVFFSTLQINSVWNLVLFVVALLSILIFLSWLLKRYLNQLSNFKGSKGLVGALILFAGISLFSFSHYDYIEESNPNLRIQWITPRVIASSKVDYKINTAYASVHKAYGQYFDCPLQEKKNIYFIFLEAYGCVAYMNDMFSDELLGLNLNLEDSLRQDHWQMSSAYTISPIKGGRSWLSFTTAMTGIKLKQQYIYDSLLNVDYDYPHLPAFLNRQGYTTHRMSTFRTTKQTDSLLSREELNAFWHFDNAIFYDHIPYKGYIYDGFGGMPDQYAMGFFQDSIRPKFSTPYYLFFITTTSHGNFAHPPPIVKNWKTLNKIKTSPNGKPWWKYEGKYSERYPKSVAYNLNFWTQFIRQYGTEDDIFILTGDHQPAGLEYLVPRSFNNAAVPIHIISKDHRFVESFYENGFTAGLLPSSEHQAVLRHEGMHSLLMRHLFKVYGTPGCKIPVFIPNGVKQ